MVSHGVTRASTTLEPALPAAHGPLSTAVQLALAGPPSGDHLARVSASVRDSDPYGLDLQLALCMCYELHYRGFAGVDPAWEWNPDLLHLRAELERAFLAGVRRDVGPIEPNRTSAVEMEAISVEPVDGTGPSYYLRDTGTWEQMREYFVHRSMYHLKEGDPHAWAIPRLTGGAKAAFVAIEFDEYGAGQRQRAHQQLFADLLTAADLDETYLGYLDAVPAEALAVVNLMSLFGLHRRLRGAAIGHFAATEITSSPGSRRIAEALERMGAPRGLRRVLPRTCRGRRRARTGGTPRCGRRSRRTRSPAGPRRHFRDARIDGGRRSPGGQDADILETGSLVAAATAQLALN